MTISFDPPATANIPFYADKPYRELRKSRNEPAKNVILPDGTEIEQDKNGSITRVTYSSGIVVWVPEPEGTVFVTNQMGTTFAGRDGGPWFAID